MRNIATQNLCMDDGIKLNILNGLTHFKLLQKLTMHLTVPSHRSVVLYRQFISGIVIKRRNIRSGNIKYYRALC